MLPPSVAVSSTLTWTEPLDQVIEPHDGEPMVPGVCWWLEVGVVEVGPVLSMLPPGQASSRCGTYIDLVALERNASSGPRQALEDAAEVGDSWVFRRIGEELARSRWSGTTPWEALSELADELNLPDLTDLADIMRLSGDEGAAVYQTLRARSAAVRNRILSKELAEANATGERMSMPVAVLAIIFLVILGAPAVLRVLV